MLRKRIQKIQTEVNAAPDEMSRREIGRMMVLLLIGSVIFCWIAQEIVHGLAITIPVFATVVFHAIYIIVVFVGYPIYVKRNEEQSIGGV